MQASPQKPEPQRPWVYLQIFPPQSSSKPCLACPMGAGLCFPCICVSVSWSLP